MLVLKNDQGIVKKAPIGFSWTMFFFGIFVPVMRGDFKWTFILFLFGLFLNGIFLGLGFLFTTMFAFTYNDLYLTDLKKKGYRVIDY